MDVLGIKRLPDDLHADRRHEVRGYVRHNRLMLRGGFERAHPAAVSFHQDDIDISPGVQCGYGFC